MAQKKTDKKSNPEKVFEEEVVTLDWERRAMPRFFRASSLDCMLPLSKYTPPEMPQEDLIRARKLETEQIGKSQLWSGYNQPYAKRTPKEVSTTVLRGRFYSMFVQMLKPDVVVEFGAAFGVSGMYWLSALEANQKGHLYSYEINKKWCGIAKENMAAISDRFTITHGLFEEKIDSTFGSKKIDLAFIDGVHTSEWVIPQYEIVVEHARKGTTIILDDIAFSDDMEECWTKLSTEDRVKNAFRLNGRVGVIQLH